MAGESEESESLLLSNDEPGRVPIIHDEDEELAEHRSSVFFPME
jgi:hypothetical protein